MQHVLAPSGLPTPPASPLSFDHPKCVPQQHHHFFHQAEAATIPQCPQQRYVPVTPEERIGTFLGSSLQLTGIIGTGAYGVVYEAVDVKTNIRYAVKALSKLNADGTPLEARQIEYQTREIRLHYLASAHPNVVSMFKIINDYPDCLFVVLEYCPEGDLFYNITECGQFVGKDELARRVFLQVLDAVQYLHQSGIYHRDLKPENILVADRGQTLKLADFGLATASDHSEDYGCGSTFYMSPECLGQTNSRRPYYYCAPNDVWSLGVILVNLTCGRNPWKQASPEDSTYRAYTRNPGFLKTILPLTDELDDILARIFTPNPDQRITLPELKQRILACPRFTITQQQEMPTICPQPTPPASPEHSELVNAVASPIVVSSSDYAVFDDEDEEVHDSVLEENTAPLSPAPSSQCTTLLPSSPASSVSDCSTIDALIEDDEEGDIYVGQELPEIITPPPPTVAVHPPPTHCDMLSVYEPEDASMVGVESPFQQQDHLQQTPIYHFHNVHIPQDYVSYPGGAVPVSLPEQPLVLPQPLTVPCVQHLQHPPPLQQQLPQLPQPPAQHYHHHQLPLPPPPQQQPPPPPPAPVCAGSGGKLFFPSVWDWVVGKNAQPIQQHLPIHHIPSFHHQVPMFLQGCY